MTTADRALWRLGFGLELFAAFAILTGATDIIDGVRLFIGSGARLEAVAHDPVLNSEIRYLGAVWGGFGAILWWVSNDLQATSDARLLIFHFPGGFDRALAGGRGDDALVVAWLESMGTRFLRSLPLAPAVLDAPGRGQ